MSSYFYSRITFPNPHILGLFLINCITKISYKKLGSAGGTKIKIKSVVPLLKKNISKTP